MRRLLSLGLLLAACRSSSGPTAPPTSEEVTIVQAGKHHGWPWREGGAGWPVSKCRETVPDAGDCVDPVHFCRHGAASGGALRPRRGEPRTEERRNHSRGNPADPANRSRGATGCGDSFRQFV